ncbi:hypothetical protein NL676_024467 [Syzygium grande]|nr:hypothetical protein NL676_024467 [Syzygium grande]
MASGQVLMLRQWRPAMQTDHAPGIASGHNRHDGELGQVARRQPQHLKLREKEGAIGVESPTKRTSGKIDTYDVAGDIVASDAIPRATVCVRAPFVYLWISGIRSNIQSTNKVEPACYKANRDS